MHDEDFLAEIIAERARTNPDGPTWVEARLRERRLLCALAVRRADLGLTRGKTVAYNEC